MVSTFSKIMFTDRKTCHNNHDEQIITISLMGAPYSMWKEGKRQKQNNFER
jgi:hypothetical protein